MLTEAIKNLYLVAETSFGTTPTSPTFKAVRKTAETLDYKRDTITSAEKNADRRAPYTYPGAASVTGDITSELVYGSGLDDLLASALCGTWTQVGETTTYRLKAGTTRSSMTLLRDITALTTGRYHVFSGCQANTVKFSYAPNAMPTVVFTMTGLDMADPADSAPSGATFGALTTTNPQNTILAIMTEDGDTIGNATAFDLTLENGIETKPVLGSAVPYHTTSASSTKIGDRKPTGTITMIFDDDQAARIAAFKAGTTYAITFKTSDAAGNAYLITLPKIKYTAVPTAVGDDGTSAMTFSAEYDATSETEFYIDRIPAA